MKYGPKYVVSGAGSMDLVVFAIPYIDVDWTTESYDRSFKKYRNVN